MSFPLFSINPGLTWQVLTFHYPPWPSVERVVRSSSFQWATWCSEPFLLVHTVGLPRPVPDLLSESRTLQGPLESDKGTLNGNVTYRRRWLQWTVGWVRNKLLLCWVAKSLGLGAWKQKSFVLSSGVWFLWQYSCLKKDKNSRLLFYLLLSFPSACNHTQSLFLDFSSLNSDALVSLALASPSWFPADHLEAIWNNSLGWGGSTLKVSSFTTWGVLHTSYFVNKVLLDLSYSESSLISSLNISWPEAAGFSKLVRLFIFGVFPFPSISACEPFRSYLSSPPPWNTLQRQL